MGTLNIERVAFGPVGVKHDEVVGLHTAKLNYMGCSHKSMGHLE